MTYSELDSLAKNGFMATTQHRLDQIADLCSAECVRTGDSRFCILSECLQALWEWWDGYTEDAGGVPTALIAEIDRELIRALPPILSTESAASAAQLAAKLRAAIFELLLPPSKWADWKQGRPA